MINFLRKLLGFDIFIEASTSEINYLRQLLEDSERKREEIESMVFTRFGIDAKQMLELKKEESELARVNRDVSGAHQISKPIGPASIRAKYEAKAKERAAGMVKPQRADDNLRNFASSGAGRDKVDVDKVSDEVDAELAAMDAIVAPIGNSASERTGSAAS